LPWGLNISDYLTVKNGYSVDTLFHPTFLYESLGCLALAFVLIALEKRLQPAPGRILAWYVMGYSALRFGIEGLRIDPAHSAGGLRLNQWVSLGAFSAAAIFIGITRLRSRDDHEASTVNEHE
jgi:prolipoprotein diacylglyceryltransferase